MCHEFYISAFLIGSFSAPQCHCRHHNWKIQCCMQCFNRYLCFVTFPFNRFKTFFMSTNSETRELSWCQLYRRWWQQRMSMWQPPVPPVTKKLASWQLWSFSDTVAWWTLDCRLSHVACVTEAMQSVASTHRPFIIRNLCIGWAIIQKCTVRHPFAPKGYFSCKLKRTKSLIRHLLFTVNSRVLSLSTLFSCSDR